MTDSHMNYIEYATLSNMILNIKNGSESESEHNNNNNNNNNKNMNTNTNSVTNNNKNVKSFLIIDVRDVDFAGGHIIMNCVNIFHTNLEKQWSTVISDYSHIPLLIFHCMYSEIRGPAAYQRYQYLTQTLLKMYKTEKQPKQEQEQEQKQSNSNNNSSSEKQKQNKANIEIYFQGIGFVLNDEIVTNLSKQQIKVLKGGFYEWVEQCQKHNQLQLIQDYNPKMWQTQTQTPKK
jgi:hypothetical protein